MAIDTTEKKLSLLQYNLPFVRAIPEADATIDQGDKQHLLRLYSGIEADPPVIPDANSAEFGYVEALGFGLVDEASITA